MSKAYEKISINNLDHYGRGIAKIDNKITFISNTLPGEIVDINITKEEKKINEAEFTKYHSFSKERIEPKCPYYQECGGCDLMHMNYQYQLKFKENKIKDIMHKFAGIDSSLIKPIIGTDQFNYRNKVTLQVKEKIGYYKKKSYDIITIDKCIISDDKINDLINQLKDISLNNIKQIVIRASLNADDTMVVLDTVGKINEKEIINKIDSNIIKKYNNNYSILKGNDYIIEKLGDYEFYISPESFFQVNTNGALNLYNQVLKYASLTGKEKILDLYCGTGTIGMFLVRHSKEVIGIEINGQAIKDANKNKELNKINNISFICGDAGVVTKELKYQPDIVVLDPPRSGLNAETINEVIKINSGKIIYVSCDPVTLARDLKILNEHYNINEITPVDMFPNTHHVECVVLMSLR